MHALRRHLRSATIPLAVGWVGLGTVALFPGCAANRPDDGAPHHAELIRADHVAGLGITGRTADVIAQWRQHGQPPHRIDVSASERVLTIHAPAPTVFALRSHDDGHGRIHLVETVFDRQHTEWREHARSLRLNPQDLVGDYTGIRRLDVDTLAPDQREGMKVLVFSTDDPSMFALVESGHDVLYGVLRRTAGTPADRWDSLPEFQRIETVIRTVRSAIDRGDSHVASQALSPYARVRDPRIAELRRSVAHLANSSLSDTKLEAHRAWTAFRRELRELRLDEAFRRLGDLDGIRSRFVDAHGNHLALTDAWPKVAWQQIVHRASQGPGMMASALGGRLTERRAHWRNRLDQLATVARVCVELDAAETFSSKADVFEGADARLDRGLTQPLWRELRPEARRSIAQSLVDRGGALDPNRSPHAAAAHEVVAQAIEREGMTYAEGSELLAVGEALDATQDLPTRCEALRSGLAASGRTTIGARALRALAAPSLDELADAAQRAGGDGLVATAAGLHLWHEVLAHDRQFAITDLDDADGHHPARAALAHLAARVLPALQDHSPHAGISGEVLYAISGDWPLARQFGLVVNRAAAPRNVLAAHGEAPQRTDVLVEDDDGRHWLRASDARVATLQPFSPAPLTYPPAIDEFRKELIAERAWLVAVGDGLRRGALQPDLQRVRDLVQEMERSPKGPIQDVDTVDRRTRLLLDGSDRAVFEQQRREHDRRRNTFESRARSYNRQISELARRHDQRQWSQYADAIRTTCAARLDVGLDTLESVDGDRLDREIAWRRWIFGIEGAAWIGPPIRPRPREELQILRGTLTTRIRTSADAAGCAAHLLRDIKTVRPEDGDLCTVMVRTYLDRFGAEAFAAHAANRVHDLDSILRGIARVDRNRIERLLRDTPPQR